MIFQVAPKINAHNSFMLGDLGKRFGSLLGEQWRRVKRCGPAEVLVFYGSPAFLLSWNFIVKVTFVSLAMGQPFLVIFWIVLVINSHHVANHRYDAFISQNGKHDYTLP